MIRSSNTIAVTVWFHPSQPEADAVRRYVSDVSRTIIVDNSPTPNDALAATLENTEYYFLGGNRGIAFALNEGCRIALSQGAEWVLTMDQDSLWNTHSVAQYMAIVNTCPIFNQVAIFAPHLIMGNNSEKKPLPRFDSPWKVMTSGNLLRLEAWSQVNGFCDDFFIDNVDDEFNCRLARSGWRIVRTHTITLTHHLGNGYTTLPNGHPYVAHTPERYFYIGRNIRRMIQLYPEHAAAYRRQSWKELKRLCLYDHHDKRTKIAQYLRGWREGNHPYPMPFRLTAAPETRELREWMEQIPTRFFVQGKVIYNARNQIRVMTLPNGEPINVKRYRSPGLFNRIIYSTLRKPKAERAYRNALLLASYHIPTPQPLGYILCGKRWLCESYLITRQEPLQHNFYEFRDHSVQGYEDVISAFAQLVASMHTQGIVHLDLSPGNILWDRNPDGTIRLSIVDINRMAFHQHPNLRQCCHNFHRLWGRRDFIHTLSIAYAQARGWDSQTVEKNIKYYWKKFWHIRTDADIQRLFGPNFP